MTENSEIETPLKLFKLINPRSEKIPVIVYIRKKWKDDEESIWVNELKLLDLKYKAMKIKINERVPINSKIENFQWYLTKDKYGFVYFFLANDSFEEKYIFKMQNKIKNFLETNLDSIEDFDKKEFFFERMTEIVDEFNIAVARNLEISSENSDIQFVEAEEDISIGGQNSEIESEQNFYHLIEKRNSRLNKILIIWLIACFLGIFLGILHIYLYFAGKKKK